MWQRIAMTILVFFYMIYLGKMLSQRKRGVKTDQMAHEKSGNLFYIELLLKTSTYCVVLVEIFSILRNISSLPTALRISGLILAVFGDIVFALAVWTMQDNWRAGIAKNDEIELVTLGIYGLSRNPAFLGFHLVYIGILMMFFNVLLLLFSLFAMVMLHLQILQEEKYLPTVFGESYFAYKNKVGRYFWKL